MHPPDLVSLVAGEMTAASLAEKHGVTEAEVLRWRSAYLAGMRAASGGQVATRRLRLGRWGFVGAMVLASVAFAQLVTFTANAPALASDVNANFNQLKTWLETKVGSVANAGITATSVTAPRVEAGYLPLQYADWTAVSSTFPNGTGILNDNAGYKALMVVGNTSAGGAFRKVQLYDDVLVSRNLSVNGDLSCGANAWGSGPNIQSGIDRGPCPAAAGQRCPNGQYMCGISFNHGCGVNWWQEGVNIECCSL